MTEDWSRHEPVASGGVVEREPVVWHGDPERRFQIGSITKVFTGLLLASYVVDGTLRLDHRVAHLVPDLAESPVAAVTLAQLSTHTSGLPRIPAELWSRALRRHPDPYADLDHDRLVASLHEVKLRPRKHPAYSNLGVGLLGHALATWAATDYDTLVRERIAEPLGMVGTTTMPEDEPVGRRRRGRAHRTTWHFDALAGCGALWSTVSDLQRFLGAQLEPPPDELGAAIRLTQEPRVRGRRVDQCLGWVRLHGGQQGQALLWHNGGTAGYRSFIGLQQGSGVVVLSARDRSVDAVGIRRLRDLGGGQRS